MNQYIRPCISVLAGMLLISTVMDAQTVSSWKTAAGQSQLFQKQDDVHFSGKAQNNPVIRLDEAIRYQSMEGFGWTMTEGSAYWLMQLPDNERKSILEELFSVEKGLGSEMIRIAVGASDLGQGVYTYQDNPNCPFSLAGPDRDYLIPVLQEIVGINPGVRFLVSPWSAPAWMKSNNSLIGGSLKKEYFAAYVAYLLNYLQAMAEQGIAIYALTIQNEPLHPGNNPSMYMSKEDQYDFVQYYLGPALQKSPFPAVRLLAYDHNCDNIDYPVYVARSEYITGSAFHLYAGPIEALSTVYQQTKKDIYFTEQWTSGKGRFDEDFTFHIREVMLGSVNNWSKTALSWNVASNEKWEPYTPEGGCNLCKGAITIDSETKSVIRNVTYYTTAQMSKVIRSGAVRIASETANNQLVHAAFINPCGSTALVVFNKGDKLQNFDIQWKGKICTYALEGHTVASLIWNEK